MRFSSLLGGLLAALLPHLALAQAAVPAPSFYTTYNYTTYTVYDTTTPDAPTRVSGVGGSLTLQPDGRYEKHLSIVAPSGPYYFNQKGLFTLRGDSIRFAFTDEKGADVQRGTFQLDSLTRRLTLTILGYPTGNKGVYELMPTETPPPALPTKTSKRRRR